MAIAASEVSRLRWQRRISYLSLFWFAPLFHLLVRGVGGYRLVGLFRLRQQVAAQVHAVGHHPLLLCANHLTLIDSMILEVFLFPMGVYFRRFRLLPWNVPELDNFGRRIWLRLMCYLGKCVYVERQGSAESKRKTLEKLAELLKWRELVLIFPEGGRSRTGRVDPGAAAYGVGSLLRQVPECRVLCLYLRGKSQGSYSDFPRRKEEFYLQSQIIHPRTELAGHRADRDLSLQVLRTLQGMEEKYFAGKDIPSSPVPSAVLSSSSGL